MSALVTLFQRANQAVPSVLSDWENKVDNWCNTYRVYSFNAQISEVNLDMAVFIFDHTAERVILSYAVSVKQLMRRDANRIRGFPNVKKSLKKVDDREGFIADKGHFLGHASGGSLDINLFPHRRELNRGWSPEGKIFRKMEQYTTDNTGTFFYHRPIYNDETWVPQYLEYGVLYEHSKWWTKIFKNK